MTARRARHRTQARADVDDHYMNGIVWPGRTVAGERRSRNEEHENKGGRPSVLHRKPISPATMLAGLVIRRRFWPGRMRRRGSFSFPFYNSGPDFRQRIDRRRRCSVPFSKPTAPWSGDGLPDEFA
jgi:hypothetical protein